jgi:lysophospholipase L1-like esterase
VNRFLALGDSYTVGEGVTRNESWPLVLTGLLEARSSKLEAPQVIAATGWTTDELMAGIEAERPTGPCDLVTLLIGVNDHYRGRPASQYRTGLVPLLERAVALAGGGAGHVLLISIPDWGLTPFAAGRDRAAIAAGIAAFNAVAEDEAICAGARWVDIRPVQDAPNAAGADDHRFVSDNLHPSASAYQAWAAAMLPFALAALGRV